MADWKNVHLAEQDSEIIALRSEALCWQYKYHDALCRIHIKTNELEPGIDALRARVEKLEAVLRTALEWDGADSEGVDAVWADEAKALLAESGPVFGIKPANSNDSPLAECEEVERG